jgi:coenzyme Q-binding protein COQ10
MFDLAADVERYPQFLRGWRAVRIIGRDAVDGLMVEQVVGLGPLHWRFFSSALLHRPGHLCIRSTGRPFDRLQIDWRFADCPDNGCTVDFGAICALRQSAIEALASRFLDTSFGDIVSTFEQRAQSLYGRPNGPKLSK